MINYLRQMAIFAKTIDHGSFRAAAKALNLSPSVVSSQIAGLEESLGVALIYRSTRSISLTKDGERLLAAAQHMLASAEQGIQSLTDKTGALSGELRITMPAVMAHSNIIQKISDFSKTNPNVELTIDFSDMQRNLIKDGFDLSIRMGWLKDSTLITKKLSDEKRCLVASKNYANERTKPENPTDLVNWDWLELTPVKGIKHRFTHKKHGIRSVKPSSTMSINDAFALYQFARSGNGLASVPEFVAKADIEAGTMENILPEWHLESLGIYALWHQNAPKNGLTRYLIDHLAS